MSGKKFFALTLVFVLLLALTAGMAAADPKAAKKVVPTVTDPGFEPYDIINGQILYAGQDIEVGKVVVTNNATHITVEFVLDPVKFDEGWRITETHVHAGAELGLFPLNDGGNPQVGLFEFSGTGTSYTIPYTGLAGEQMLIAAHAVVEKVEVDTYRPDLTWKRSLERTSADVNPVNFFSGLGAQWTVADAFAIELDAEQVVWDNGLYHAVTGVTAPNWASWKYAYNWGAGYSGQSDLRRFQAAFDLPEGYEVLSGKLISASEFNGIPINDNVYIFLNDDLLFWGGTRVNQMTEDDFLGIVGIQALRGAIEPKETDRWYIPGTLPDITGFLSGSNHLDVFTEENEQWGGMGKLLLELEYRLTTNESAWAAGTRFVNPGNWATFFEYTIAGQLTLLETVFVPSTLATGVTTTNLLLDGQKYLLKASGTYTYNNAGDWADAEWYLKNGVIVKGDTEGSVPYVLDVSLAGYSQNIDWGPYNSEHMYEYTITGVGSTLRLFIHDSAYGDNNGNIKVEIYIVNY